MRRWGLGALLASSALLAGCATELAVRPHSGQDYSAGIPLVLPFTQYTVTQTWRLTSCTEADPVALKVEAVAGEAEDDNHRYLIDPTSLERALTVSKFDAIYFEDSMMLKSINAEAEDRTAAFIANVAKTVATLAPLAMGVPLGPLTRSLPGAKTPAPQYLCKDEAAKAVLRAGQLKAELDGVNSLVAEATDEVLRLAAAAAQMGSAIDPDTSARYGEAIKKLDELTQTQAKSAAQLGEALRPITFQLIRRWPEDSAGFESQAAKIDEDVLARWFKAGPPYPPPPVYLKLERLGRPQSTSGGLFQAAAAQLSDPLNGIPFRSPRPGRLIACDKPCATKGAQQRPIAEGPVAQLGSVDILPVRTKAFGSAAMSAEFRRNGSLASAGYAQRTAPLEQASAAIAGAAGEIVPLIDPTQRLARETAYLNALKARRDAEQALQPAELSAADASRAALEADSVLLNAHISNLQARLTLQELQARSAVR